MATTTNFGWETPDDTDLVKDGALAMRTLGNSIDTSFVDLKGGTTGQILSKASNTDLDYTWINNDQGDITAVTAGTGLTGGGTTGAVTLTNDMATTITAAGDIVVGTGSGTYDNLPIGTTGQVLTADTTVSPYKVKWATAASGSTFVGCSAQDTGDQNINNTTATVVTWNAENFDSDGFHSTTTNTGRLTIPTGKTGYYQINARARWDENASNQRTIWIQKNGTTDLSRMDTTPSTNYPGSMQSLVVYLVAGDYIQMIAYQESGGTRLLRKSNQAGSFDIAFLGA